MATKNLANEIIIANKIKEFIKIEDENKLHLIIKDALEEIDSNTMLENDDLVPLPRKKYRLQTSILIALIIWFFLSILMGFYWISIGL